MAITHGVNISVGQAIARPQLASPAIVGVVGEGSGGSVVINKPTVVRNVTEATTIFGTGALLNAIKAIFSQTECIVVGVLAADASRNAVNAVEALERAESETGYRPNYIDAPGLTVNSPVDNLVNIVATQLQTTAERLRAVAYVKASSHGTTSAAALANYMAWRAANPGNRLVPVPQDATIVDGSGTLEVPGSALLLGVRGRLDGERRFGYARNVSSKPVSGISSVARAFSFALDVPSDAQSFSNAGATIFVQDEGRWQTFGGWTGYGATDARRSEHALNVVDHIYRRATRIAKRLTDSAVSAQFPDVLAGDLQDYFSALIGAGAILSGTARPNEAANTAANLRAGNVSIAVDNLVVTGVARRININLSLAT